MTQKIYFSIDVGGTQIKHALINGSGKIIEKAEVNTPRTLPEFLETIDSLISRHQSSIHGVAISCPGKVDSKNGIIYFGGSLTYLHKFNLPQYIKEQFALPSVVINDGKAAALSELWLGNLKGILNGAAISLGTAVGGGLIINGQLVLGHHFQATELSFVAIPQSEFKVDTLYGLIGSAVQMIKRIATVLELEDKKDGLAVFEYINKKDDRIYPIFQDYCRNIAYLIYNMQAVVDVERYVIGGGISAQAIVVSEIKHQYQ